MVVGLDVPLILAVAARLEQRRLFACGAVVNRLHVLRVPLLRQRLVMERHAEGEGARTEQ
jgi:hypothetical protein